MEISLFQALTSIFFLAVVGFLTSYICTSIYRRLKKEDKKDEKESDISNRIELILKTLSKSSAELHDLQLELESKIQYVNDLNAEANQAQSLLSLSHDQIEAIKTMINKEAQTENRANFWKSVLVNFIFFILGAVASYIISKYLV